MTKYTDTNGNNFILCDNCRCDLPQGASAFTMAASKVADGYVTRDYDKGEMILCPVCASTVAQIMNLMGIKRADSLAVVQEAA